MHEQKTLQHKDDIKIFILYLLHNLNRPLAYDDINDLYLASDLLITDYSSVFFDYSNLGRPIIFYMYDLDQYEHEMRGFYLSIDELPGPIVTAEEELINEIRKSEEWSADEKYLEFNRRFNPHEDGNASARVLARIFRK